MAALFVATGGCYFGLPDVDPWDEWRDARLYAGPHPVVAHPPCKRWGRYWYGSPLSEKRFAKGDDGGCFAAALAAVRRWGGVLEHPAGSHAWTAYRLKAPGLGRWYVADAVGGWSCQVDQGHYGHGARKATWLYAARCYRTSLRWDKHPARDHKNPRRGLVALMSHKERDATPPRFRDLLLSMAETARVSAPSTPSFDRLDHKEHCDLPTFERNEYEND